eukprot:TRINITY_DN12168_c0_g1_i11.p4 TRINITY_DN12168_c0_g1~~TRINITY_DN12168_c0_g1_i11.p4  ORF type:complete len:223 (+),score=29.68 TRINITY_DN12168_c0_g1_i11:3025-3693(+)
MMDLLSILSAFATVATIGLFLTGVPVTQRIRKARSSANVAFFPYLAGIFSGILWLKYGMLSGDSTIVVVNGTGAALNAYYLLVCYTYTKQPASFARPTIIAAAIVYATLAYVKFNTTNLSEAMTIVGYIGCTATVIMFGSPLTTIGAVLKTRSTETMVFSLCLMNFVVSVTWALYGYVKQDNFIQLPNSFGALLSLLQLLLFVKYPSNGGPGHVYDVAARLI